MSCLYSFLNTCHGIVGVVGKALSVLSALLFFVFGRCCVGAFSTPRGRRRRQWAGGGGVSAALVELLLKQQSLRLMLTVQQFPVRWRCIKR